MLRTRCTSNFYHITSHHIIVPLDPGVVYIPLTMISEQLIAPTAQTIDISLVALA